MHLAVCSNRRCAETHFKYYINHYQLNSDSCLSLWIKGNVMKELVSVWEDIRFYDKGCTSKI